MQLPYFLFILALITTPLANADSANQSTDPVVKGPIFERVIFIGVPAAKVWSAITKPEIVNQYYLAPLAKLELKAGGKIYYGSEAEHLIEGEVLEVVDGLKLVHSFKFPQSTDPTTRVTYEIQPMGEMCALTLRHDQFPTANQTYSDVNGGWDVILSSLKTLLETGKTLPWPKPKKAG